MLFPKAYLKAATLYVNLMLNFSYVFANFIFRDGYTFTDEQNTCKQIDTD